MGRLLAGLLGASLALCSPAALAQSDQERAAARNLANQGAEAFEQGRYEESISLFEKAERLVHAPPHLLFIARATDKLGRLVRAHESYQKVVRERLPDNAPAAFTEAQQAADAELEQLKKRLPYVSIVVQGATDGVHVTMDGAKLPDSLVGIPMPVNPGHHEFLATAPGMQSAVSTIDVEEGAKETIVLTLRSAAEAQPTPGSPPPDTAGASSPPVADRGGSSTTIGAYVAFGVGAVGLGVGTAYLLKYNGKKSDGDDLYDSCAPGCTDTQQAEISDLDGEARSAGTVSTVSYVLAGVGMAAGVVMLLLDSPNEASGQSATTVLPWVGYRSAGVAGRF